jgi:hypothetical protein
MDGAPGEAVAYAEISASGHPATFGGATNNVPDASVSHPSPGIYCFGNLPFNVHSAMVSTDNASFNDFTLTSVIVGFDLDGCGPVDSVRVRTVTFDSAGAYSPPVYADSAFYIWFED